MRHSLSGNLLFVSEVTAYRQHKSQSSEKQSKTEKKNYTFLSTAERLGNCHPPFNISALRHSRTSEIQSPENKFAAGKAAQ